MANQETYRVFITCQPLDGSGRRTRDYLLARQLWKYLGEKDIPAYFHQNAADAPLSPEAAAAVSQAEIFIVAGASPETVASPAVRRDYEAFRASVLAGEKERFRIAAFLMGMEREELPDVLRESRSFSHAERDRLAEWIQEQLGKEPAKACVSDAEEEPSVFIESLEPLPESSESAEESPSLPEWQAAAPSVPSSSVRRRRIAMEPLEEPAAPSFPQGEARTPAAPSNAPVPMPVLPVSPSVPAPAAKNAAPVKVRPEKINKVDFSVVSPEAVRPGGSGTVDVFMYTKSQRKIVDRAIKAAKEKVTESAHTGSSVSVRQGSRVTVVLTSSDAQLAEDSETLLWNGDALDFTFRFSLPEDFKKKAAEFGCNVLFDGIHITRLYFSVPVNRAKTVPVKFVRKDSRRAFVSYSSKDRPEVVEQLAAIQSVAPKLRFWMDSQSMTAGDAWRPAIIAAINRADIFLLFWSPNAKASNEVRKEWEYALALEQGRAKQLKNGLRFISPVPLVPPKECPPPAELNDLHFGDPSFDGSIDGIDKVHFVAKEQRPGNIRFF